MNSYDIFKKLTKGIKFNNKKFKNDYNNTFGVSKRKVTRKYKLYY